MKVQMAICLEDWSVTGKVSDSRVPVEQQEDATATLKRGQEYTVSAPHDDGTVTVFSSYWFRAPQSLFGGFRPL